MGSYKDEWDLQKETKYFKTLKVTKNLSFACAPHLIKVTQNHFLDNELNYVTYQVT